MVSTIHFFNVMITVIDRYELKILCVFFAVMIPLIARYADKSYFFSRYFNIIQTL